MHLVDHRLPDTFKQRWESVSRDSDHCSSAFRMASFTTGILSSFDTIEHVDTESLETLFYNLPLALQLIDDDLSIEGCNGITGMELSEQREEYMETLNDGRKVVSKWIHSDAEIISGGATLSSKLSSFWANQLDKLDGISPAAYRVGEAFVKIMASVGSLNKAKSTEEITKLCKETRTANAIRSAAWLTSLRHLVIFNPAGTRLCNELVADSTGLNTQDELGDGEYPVALFINLLTCLRDPETGIPQSVTYGRG